ncbi:ketopantoate reductase PanE/ApbA C terminal-domain-containing protein [Aspergillus ambiguus]|uniref:ketopantoate reductase family protein n=1 Tax=Aspergillus ambiguus TaxID=176160 RepID=UPI003CCCED3D
MPSPPSVLLFGVGSIGAVYLHQLQQAGCIVTAVCRSNYDAVQKNGFTLRSERFGTITYRPDHLVRTVADCPADAVYDYLIVTTKSFPATSNSNSDNSQRQPLAAQLQPALAGRPSTTIVLAQNGIDIEPEIATAFPANPLLSGVIYLPATQTAPGIIEYPETLNLLELGTYPADAPAAHKASARRLADLMIRGGGEVAILDDIQTARWSKLLINASWNPICALALCTDGDFLRSSDPFAHDLVWGIMMEIVALARAMGVAGVDEAAAEKRFAIAKRRAEAMTGREPSMLQDVRQGRLFEVEAIVGNTVRVGRKWGVAMPRLETVYALAKGRYDSMVREG